MTTAHDIDWPQVLAERLTTTHPDVRELLATFIHTLMGAEADWDCTDSSPRCNPTLTSAASWPPTAACSSLARSPGACTRPAVTNVRLQSPAAARSFTNP
jgi:hypothetical protein